MQDVTNNLNNIGKLRWQRKFQVSLSYEELRILKALTQNPHENYQDSEEFMNYSESLFEDISGILDRIPEDV